MKAKAFEKLAENVINNLKKRNMEGYESTVFQSVR